MNLKENSTPNNWVSYRPEIKVLDCTIRDGGLMNDSQFSDEVVRGVYDACVAAGIDYMEIGYKNSDKIFTKDKYGCWRHCHEKDIRRVIGENESDLKISVMADAEKSDYKNDILPRDQSPIDMIRVACYIHQIPLALDMIHFAREQGYETTLNIMAASTLPDQKLDSALELAAKSGMKAIYLVDSFGRFYSEEIQYFIRKYLSFTKPEGMEVGIHAHNNLQLAYSNTIESIVQGANFIDATMAGLGRGAGNCQMELLLGFLHNPKYKLRPVLECVQKYIEPMRAELGWGFNIPYMLTGLYNRHPRSAIEYNAGPDKDDLVKFYDQLIDAL